MYSSEKVVAGEDLCARTFFFLPQYSRANQLPPRERSSEAITFSLISLITDHCSLLPAGSQVITYLMKEAI